MQGKVGALEGNSDPMDEWDLIMLLNLEEIIQRSHQILLQQIRRIFDDLEVGRDVQLQLECFLLMFAPICANIG